MSAIDPITGQPLPTNAIQRVLFIGSQVHVYQIPPLTSTKGYTAATWTEDPKRHIFTARLRVLETGTDSGDDDDDEAATDNVKVDVVLEDPASGQLFAAAPYNDAGVVESALDSSRFFAVRVQDGQGRRAMIGIGFEERPDAFDFGVALQEARKTIGLEGGAGGAGAGAAAQSKSSKKDDEAAEKRDYSLKDGETITINLGGSSKFGRRSGTSSPSPAGPGGGLSGFSLAPPPSASASSSTAAPASSSSASASAGPASSFSLPPPPPPNRRTANRRSVGDPSLLAQQLQQQLQQPAKQMQQAKSAAELGFDDGQFGEFA